MNLDKILQGKYIVLEGLEGAGKSTAASYVMEWLEKQGIPEKSITQTREPGGTELAERMRDVVKCEVAGEELQDKAELLLMYAARVQLVEHTIKPALAMNHVVLGDRHDWSSRAYQGGGRQICAKLIQNISDITLDGFKPDFTLYLDINPEIGLMRAAKRGELDRIERQALNFFHRTRAVYKDLVRNEPNSVSIDAEKSPESVKQEIFKELDSWLKSKA